MLAPDRAYRLLALVRFWNVIDRFYPYKRLLDRPWESVLPEFVPRFEQADGADAYARAVLEMASRIQDSHVWVAGKSVLPITGEVAVGLYVQLLDGLPVVIEVLDPAAAAGGVRAGDVIEEVDGEPVLARAARLEKYAPSSRPLGRQERALFLAMAGADGSAVTLKLAGEGGSRTVTLKRGFYPRPAKTAFRLLEGNLGYVDLTRLTRDEVGKMFDELGSTKALVLDMRGYPNGTAWSIAPRINVKKAAGAAWFERHLLSGDIEEGRDGTFKFQQKVPPGEPGKPLYRGRVVMLINEFAISQSEHSGLFFEAATDLTYVGSPTAGANGDVTVLTLPGGIWVSFTGHDVRHADGRQLQRIGLEPQVPVRPTLKGVRAGRDEVLERALQFLADRK
jgi:C-terminal processing protease CtpA/Prc